MSITDPGSGYTDGTYYNIKLINSSSPITGDYATVKVEVSGGEIISIKVMDGGSAYGVGNTLTLQGLSSTTNCVLTVDTIYDNSGDTIRIMGVSSKQYVDYNTLYRIESVPVGSEKSISVVSTTDVNNFSTVGIAGEVSEATYLPENQCLFLLYLMIMLVV